MALWDIVGKALDRPVYDLLGGLVRERLPAYANAWYGAGATLDDIARAAAEVAARGYRGLKLDPFANAGRDPDAKLIRAAVDLVARVRDAVGPDMEILIDCHGRFSPASAIAIAQDLEPCKLYWLEEPCDPENVQALAKVGRSISHAARHRRALLHQVPPAGAAREQRDRCAAARPDPRRRHPRSEEDRRDRRRRLHARVSSTTPSDRWPRPPASSSTRAPPTSSCRNRSASTRRPGASTFVEHPPRPRAEATTCRRVPGLGVGRFLPEAAKAHPFDPDAFLPMWSEAWRSRF